MADFYGNDIRELQQRVSKLERVLLEKGILEAPAPPEKPVIETVVCKIIAEAIQPWGGNGRNKLYENCRMDFPDLRQDWVFSGSDFA